MSCFPNHLELSRPEAFLCVQGSGLSLTAAVAEQP